MSWHAKLGGQLSVWEDGNELPGPENKTIAVLLVGLLFRDADWSSRQELADLLYPESGPDSRRASLRQSLLRLRRWCGNEALEEQKDLVRLAAGKWTFDILLGSGQNGTWSMIAPGLDHPWVEAIRQSLAPAIEPNPVAEIARFADNVADVARVDPDTGRSLFVGGAGLAQSLSIEHYQMLLNLTQPKDRRDPYVLEYLQLRTYFYERMGMFGQVKDTERRVYRLASQQRKQDMMILSGAQLLFYEIEDGQMGEAAAWIDHLQNRLHADARSLLFTNAKAAYYWNMNRFDEAISLMNLGIRRIASADRATRVHFWVNLAILCAEAQRLEQAEDALVEAKRLVVGQFEKLRLHGIWHAEALICLYRNEAAEAIRLFRQLLQANEQHNAQPGIWYASEALCVALAEYGNYDEAKRLWAANEKKRRSMCSRMTPRVLAQKSRVFRSV